MLGMAFATLEWLGVNSSADGLVKLATIRSLPSMEDLLTSDDIPCSRCGIRLCLYAYKVISDYYVLYLIIIKIKIYTLLQACDDDGGVDHEKYTCRCCKGPSDHLVRISNDADFVVLDKLLKDYDVTKPAIHDDAFCEVKTFKGTLGFMDH